MKQKGIWYELKPYLLILSGTVLAAVFEFATVGQALSIALLFLGATISIWRLDFRRRDKGKRTGAMQEAFYEYWPYFHLALGVIVLSMPTTPLVAFVALAVSLRGIVLVYFRQQHRLRIIKPLLGS